MKGLPFVLLFTAMTFVAWGAYGPTLHHGAMALSHDSLRAFVGVGLAYFLIAVLIPFAILKKSGESGNWTITGTIYSLVAGAVGAIGALGIILALGYGGSTIYVMPLVFGFAPVVNTLVTAFLSRTFNQISPIFIAGVIAAALGAGGVLFFKPAPVKAASAVHLSQETPAPQITDAEVEVEVEAAATDASAAEAVEKEAVETEVAATEASGSAPPAESTSPTTSVKPIEDSAAAPSESAAVAPVAGIPKPVNFWGVLGSIVVAAVCWGSYGPMLHIGQGKMSGSRLRPFACVGLAYFFIAVAAPLVLIYSRTQDQGSWTPLGMGWSFLAGIAGAVGALGVILAFNAGGKPYYVMPLIFGFAPVINTFISLSEAGTWSQVPIWFWFSLAVVIAGAVTVLTNAPKPKPKPKTA
jgi:hypothetical protein